MRDLRSRQSQSGASDGALFRKRLGPPLPGPFAMSEALIGPGALSDAALSGADSCAYPGSWVGAAAISALSSVAGRAPSSAVSIEASSRAFVDP